MDGTEHDYLAQFLAQMKALDAEDKELQIRVKVVAEKKAKIKATLSALMMSIESDVQEVAANVKTGFLGGSDSEDDSSGDSTEFEGMMLSAAILKAVRRYQPILMQDLFSALKKGGMAFKTKEDKKDYHSMRIAVYRLRDKNKLIMVDKKLHLAE